VLQLVQQFSNVELRILFANVYGRCKPDIDWRTTMFLDDETEEVAGDAAAPATDMPADDTAAEETPAPAAEESAE
jgi:hypothetical protein